MRAHPFVTFIHKNDELIADFRFEVRLFIGDHYKIKINKIDREFKVVSRTLEHVIAGGVFSNLMIGVEEIEKER